jgi:hypothetical protein
VSLVLQDAGLLVWKGVVRLLREGLGPSLVTVRDHGSAVTIAYREHTGRLW